MSSGAGPFGLDADGSGGALRYRLQHGAELRERPAYPHSEQHGRASSRVGSRRRDLHRRRRRGAGRSPSKPGAGLRQPHGGLRSAADSARSWNSRPARAAHHSSRFARPGSGLSPQGMPTVRGRLGNHPDGPAPTRPHPPSQPAPPSLPPRTSGRRCRRRAGPRSPAGMRRAEWGSGSRGAASPDSVRGGARMRSGCLRSSDWAPGYSGPAEPGSRLPRATP